MINSNQILYPFASENDLNDMTKSMKQQMKIASIGANKSTAKNKLKTSSNQNINAMVDPNGNDSFINGQKFFCISDKQTKNLSL